MKNSPQKSNLTRMFYFSFIGFLFFLFIEVFYISLLSRLSPHGVDIFRDLIVHNDYYSKLDSFLYPYIIFDNILEYNFIMFYVFFILLAIFLLVLLGAAFLRAINPSYTIENLQSKKLYFKILFFFIGSYLAVLYLFRLIEFISGFLSIGWLSLLVDILFSILILTFFIIYWHQDGLAGDLRFSKERLKLKLRQMPGAIKALNINKVSWFFKILFLYLITGFFIGYSLNYLYPYVEIFGTFTEIIIYQEYSNLFVLIPPLIFSVSLMLLYLGISNLQESFKNISLKIIPVVIILCLIFVVSNTRHENFLNSIDYYKKLSQEAGIELSKEAFYSTAIIFGENHEVFSLSAGSAYTDRDIGKRNLVKNIWEYGKDEASDSEDLSQASFVIQCSEDNVSKIAGLKPYLEDRNYRTLLGKEYYYVLNSCYKSNWETAKYADLQKSVFERTSLDFAGLRLMTSWANYDEQEVESFKNFLESGDYHIGKKSRRNIAYKFLHYNEIEEAKKWFSETDEDLEKIDFSVKAHQGRIVGKLEINEQVKDKIKIGLFLEDMPETTQQKGINLMGGREAGTTGIHGKNLVASTNIDDEGNFVFDNLFEGSYFLAVLIKEAKIEQENIIIEKTAPIIEISSDNYDYDIGEIKIILVD